MLVVANLSRFPQPVSLDLSAFKEMIPIEPFGRTEFPLITDKPYGLTLSPHAVFWFSLEARLGREHHLNSTAASEALTVAGEWEEVLSDSGKGQLEARLPSYLQDRRWFAGKSREIKNVQIREAIPLPLNERQAFFVLLLVESASCPRNR